MDTAVNIGGMVSVALVSFSFALLVAFASLNGILRAMFAGLRAETEVGTRHGR